MSDLPSSSGDRRPETGDRLATGDRSRHRLVLVVALAALATIALLLFARPLVKREVLTLRDHSDYFQPMRFFTAEELRRGHVPFWNPYNASGEPWLANPQTGVFYPPAWLFLVLPFATAYILFLALHVALLGCGTLVFLQRFASPPAAFLGALSLMLCGPSLSLLDVTNTFTTLAWLPLVLWSAIALAPPTWCAAILAMSFLAGEPFFAALGALAFVILRRRNLLDIALTAFAVSSIQLFPFLGALRGSDRAHGLDATEILRDSVAPLDWLRLIVPPLFARGAPSQHFVPVVYMGFVAAILAVSGLVAARRSKPARAAAAVLLVAIVVAGGAFVPPVAFLLTHLPVTLFRYPARMLPIGAMALVVLAAIGWDAIATSVHQRWVPIVLAAAIIVDLTPAIAPLLVSGPFRAHPTPYAGAVGRDAKIVRLQAAPLLDRARWISGYMNLFDRRFDAWTAAPVIRDSYARAYERALHDRAAFDAMSIGYVLSSRPLSGLQLLEHERSIGLYRNPRALPLAYWRGDDGRIVPASLLALTSSAMHVTVDAPGEGSVIVSEQFDAAWRATVDDVATPAERAGLFCSVRVKRGHHDVAWRYRSSSFFAGVFFTAVGLLRMLFSFLFVKHAR